MPLERATSAARRAQFSGIEHCGRLIVTMSRRRGRDFAFALRLRYDVVFSPALRLASWPIWNASNKRVSPVLALAKYTTQNLTSRGLQLHGCPWQLPARRCVPQDVFFVVRNSPGLGPVESIFQQKHNVVRRFSYSTMGRRDRPERSMYHLPLAVGAPIDVLWREFGKCLWMISSPRILFFGRVCWPRRRSSMWSEEVR